MEMGLASCVTLVELSVQATALPWMMTMDQVCQSLAFDDAAGLALL
jgi:hypothetical protein